MFRLYSYVNVKFKKGFASLHKRLKKTYWHYYFPKRYSALCDFDQKKIEPIKVDPSKVKYKVSTSLYQQHKEGNVPIYGENAVVGELSGIWDKFRVSFEEDSLFQRYRHEVKTVNSGLNDSLLYSLSKNGYMPYKKRDNDDKIIKIGSRGIPDEPRIAVGRNNELIRWTGGRHRISAAKALGLDSMYGYIVVWHPGANKSKIRRKFGVRSSEIV